MQRREFLKQMARSSASMAACLTLAGAQPHPRREKLPVAGITTVYQRNSHADVIFGKILEGYNQLGGPGPDLKLVSLYTDQVPSGDLSRALAAKHEFRICKTIEEAITVGTDGIPVAGVLSIGEHGKYPETPDTHQRMYPRRRFFDQISSTFKKHKKVVPVFSDKHLAYNWSDAKHIYDTARRMKIPFMAGSSIPVAWRRPQLELPMGCRIEEALVVGYGGVESYGFHALEGLQCMVERRLGGETGVSSVRAVQGDAVWQAQNKKRWSEELFKAALAVQGVVKYEGVRQRLAKRAPFYLIEYRDGLNATVAMANGVARQFSFAAKLKGQRKPVACLLELEDKRPYGHFSWLLTGIEHMVHTGQPAYPVERTLLTTGILDRAIHSLVGKQERLETPELAIRYKALDWPYATTKLGGPPT